MKKDVNLEFIESINYIIATKEFYKKSKIALELKISPSKISKILNKRMNVGIDVIAVFSELFASQLNGY